MNLESCVKASLAILSGDARRTFSDDPLSVLTTDLCLTVTAVDHLAKSREVGGACDGVSFLEDGVIVYSLTPGSRRENFTLAHELGHWLADQASGVYDWIADQDHPGPLLETMCDQVAQELLLPNSAVKAVVGKGPVRVDHLLALFAATKASLPVCAIALAKQITGLGAVVIIDRATATVTHASVSPDPEKGWPKVFPWPGQLLAAGHPLRSILDGGSLTRRLWWRTPWGDESEFYVDAVGDTRRVLALLSDTDVWGAEVFHAPIARAYDTRLTLTGNCCGTWFEVRGYPCSVCQKPYCPKCAKCQCERDAARGLRCEKCFQVFLPHLVVSGLCVECR
jgi:hypothetical protein